MYSRILGALIALVALPALAQNTITFTPSTTTGSGQVQTNITWSTNPPAPGATPCTATGDPAWAGPKAASGTQSLVLTSSATLNLQCSWLGDSIATFTWTNATENVDDTPYIDRAITRIKYTFNPALTATENCEPGSGDVCVDIPDTTDPRPTMHTVTGIMQTGTLRARAFHINAFGGASDPSNAVTKMFTGAVTVTESIGITVNPRPKSLSGLAIE